MAKRNDDYQLIVAEVVLGTASNGSPKKQVRPSPGQGLDTSLNIESARKLRENPVGTKFRMRVKLTDMEGAPFLYSNPRWPVEILPRE